MFYAVQLLHMWHITHGQACTTFKGLSVLANWYGCPISETNTKSIFLHWRFHETYIALKIHFGFSSINFHSIYSNFQSNLCTPILKVSCHGTFLIQSQWVQEKSKAKQLKRHIFIASKEVNGNWNNMEGISKPREGDSITKARVRS